MEEVKNMNKIAKVSLTVALIFAIASIGFANATPRVLEECNMVYWTSDDSKALPVPGNQVSGFKLTLNGNHDPNFWYYLNIKFIKPQVSRGPTPIPGAPGDAYPFYLTPPDTSDTDFWGWWAENPRLVTSSSLPGTWQWVMWRILNGVFPMFYLGVHGTLDGHYMLVDGLQFMAGLLSGQLPPPLNPLRINGDYPHGSYVFTAGTSAWGSNYLNGETMTITFR